MVSCMPASDPGTFAIEIDIMTGDRHRRGRALLTTAICIGCVHVFPAVAQAQLRAELYVSGLSAPVAFVQDPSDPNRQYVVEQGGLIRVVENGVLASPPFLNLASS